ncbi:MAG: hypothetical protein IKB73_01620 [Ruminococcus sp.]|nr:hypothetical protein [Ruminococcus sp.]
MRAKKKLSKFQYTFRKVCTIVAVLIISIVMIFELTIRDRIELAMTAQIKSSSHRVINESIDKFLTNNREICNELIECSSDTENTVKYISENIHSVNLLKTGVTQCVSEALINHMNKDGINVKLGNFTGLNLFSDTGPNIYFDIDATPCVSCEFISSFESSGVNQTVHHIKLELLVDIYVGNPIRIESIKFKTMYEVAQTVVIGSVPSAYGTISRY